MNSRIYDLLVAIADEGCDCDIMNGYACGIHALLNELKAELEECLPKTV